MKILLAVDGSGFSQYVVDEVRGRPWPTDATVRVLSVVQHVPPPATDVLLSGATTLDELRQMQVRAAEKVTAQAAESLKGAGVRAEFIVRNGEPRMCIVDEAKEWGADLIVLGSHGLPDVARWLLGSVAQSVVAHAPCSVQIVRRRDRL